MSDLRGALDRGLALAGKFRWNRWSLTPFLFLLVCSDNFAATQPATLQSPAPIAAFQTGGYVGATDIEACTRLAESYGPDMTFSSVILYALTNQFQCWMRWQGGSPYAFSNIGPTTVCASARFVVATTCPSAYACPAGWTGPDANNICSNANKNLGTVSSCTSPTTTNPIVLGTGNKYLVETDYVGSGPFPLQFTRTYNSQQNAGGGIGYNWRASFGGNIIAVSSTVASVYRPDGKVLTFNFLNSQWTPDADITDTLIQLPNNTGWKYTTADGTVETYDAAGRRTSFTNRAGLTQTYIFSDGTNSTTTGGVLHDAGGNPTNNALPPDYAIYITDQTGRKIALGYGYDTSNTIIHVVKMTDPSGGQYLYGYDTNNNLTSVTYPDGHKRTYLYETNTVYTSNTDQPHLLTGVVDTAAGDTTGTRYASYWYDTQGRAYKEEIAPSLNQGIDKYSLTYNTDASGNPTTTVVTDPLNSARTYNFQTILGVVKSTGTDQPGGSGCGAASSGITYDANGNVSSRTDFNQHKTCYAYDLTRNLETTRAEGLTSACPANLAAWTPAANTAERRITTTWHNTYRLPLVITEPGRTTTNAYDLTSGNLLTQEIKDTASGKTRTWTYTYTSATDNTLLNLLKSVDGPRPDSDVIDKTTYTYYSTDDTTTTPPKYRRGDLWKITNALSHVTQITSYDGNGRPLTIVDPNTITTTLSYTPRGWLHTRTVGSKTTTYDYDHVGQLTKVTLADGSHLDYTYDAAHRLTDITDTQLNRIHYTLDAIGNRTKEEVFDANSVLSTTKSHSFDALSRLMTDVTTYNQGTTTTLYTYDAGGNLKTVVEGQGTATPHTTTYDYDALNRLIYVGDALNQISNPTSYTYDGLDQLKSVTIPRRSVNPASITTAYTVNALGEATQESSPDSGITHRTHDEVGNLKTATDARGITSNYTWDALNRLTSITYPATGENLAYTWDSTPGCTYGIGRLCKITDAEGTTTYSYDDQGNLTQQTRQIASVNYTTGYGYDGANRLLTTTTPTGETQTLTRNPAGRINAVDTSNGTSTTLAKDIAYDGAGQVTAQTLGNGVKQSNSYDLAGLPSTRRNNAPDGDLNGDGIVDVADVALAERIALGLVTPSADQLVHGDIAPNGTPDGVIDAADVARIRRKALGLESF